MSRKADKEFFNAGKPNDAWGIYVKNVLPNWGLTVLASNMNAGKRKDRFSFKLLDEADQFIFHVTFFIHKSRNRQDLLLGVEIPCGKHCTTEQSIVWYRICKDALDEAQFWNSMVVSPSGISWTICWGDM